METGVKRPREDFSLDPYVQLPNGFDLLPIHQQLIPPLLAQAFNIPIYPLPALSGKVEYQGMPSYFSDALKRYSTPSVMPSLSRPQPSSTHNGASGRSSPTAHLRDSHKSCSTMPQHGVQPALSQQSLQQSLPTTLPGLIPGFPAPCPVPGVAAAPVLSMPSKSFQQPFFPTPQQSVVSYFGADSATTSMGKLPGAYGYPPLFPALPEYSTGAHLGMDAPGIGPSTTSKHLSELRDEDSDDMQARALKRSRLVWTPQLHRLFEQAVNTIGIDKAVPKTIMQMMNIEGLTRENVASHLQKYRLQLKKGSPDEDKEDEQPDAQE